MTIITIDGNIGVGKSTILNNLHKVYKLSVDLEPVENWTSYLKDIYNTNNAFNLQVRIWLDRCWIQEKTGNIKILFERSPHFIKKTFIEIALKNNYITNDEYNLLLDLHKKTDNNWVNNIYIYLKSDPEVCFNRIHKRNRSFEKNISLEYLNDLHKLHENTYNDLKKKNNNVHIINIEDKSISKISNEIFRIIEKI